MLFRKTLLFSSILLALEAQVDRGEYVKATKLTVGNYLESWLNDCLKPDLSPKTFDLYYYLNEKHIKPAIDNLPLSDLKPASPVLSRGYS